MTFEAKVTGPFTFEFQLPSEIKVGAAVNLKPSSIGRKYGERIDVWDATDRKHLGLLSDGDTIPAQPMLYDTIGYEHDARVKKIDGTDGRSLQATVTVELRATRRVFSR